MPFSPDEERLLVDQARNDPEAFGVLFDAYYPAILRYAARRTGHASVAADIASETFYKAFKSLWRFRWQQAPFSAWLYRIATNEVNGYFRKGAHAPVSLDAMYEEDPNFFADPRSLIQELEEAEYELSRHQEFIRAREAISILPIPYQEVLTLRFFEEKKISEIAAILGKKEGTVKSLLSRGLDQLASMLQTQPSVNSRITTKDERHISNRIANDTI